MARRFALLLTLALLPSLGFAQSKKDKEEAGSHFTKGIEFYKEGNFAAALAEFRAAYRAVPSYEVLFNLGLSERRLFKYGDAVKTLNQYLSEGGAKVSKDRREAVKKELDAIREMVAEVTIKVEGSPAQVELDGEKLGKSPFKQPLLVGPGKHTFRAEREGEQPDEKTIELTSLTKVEVVLKPHPKELVPGDLAIESNPSGATITVDGKVVGATPLKLSVKEGGHEVIAELDGYATARTEVLVTGGQSRKMTIELDAQVRKKKLKLPLLGLGVTGGGVVLIAVGAIVTTSATGASNQVSALFKAGGKWDDRYAGIEAGGKSAQTWSTALMVTGGIVAAAGIVIGVITLLSSGGGEESTEESGFYFAPGPSGATVGWSLRW